MSGAQANTETQTPAPTEQPQQPNLAEKLYPTETPPAEKPAEVPAENKPAEAPKKIEPAKPTDKPSEDLKEITLPEGSFLSPEDMKSVQEFAKANGLTNKQAQDLLNSESERLNAFVKVQTEAYEAKVKGYEEIVKSDKEIGGANFNKSITLAKRTLERFGNDTLKAELDQSGFGSHPEVIRLLARIGAQISDDKIVGVNNPPPPVQKTTAEYFYGNKN